jgi:hypothetical protein
MPAELDLMKGYSTRREKSAHRSIVPDKGEIPVQAGVEALTILGETGDGGVNDRAVRECFARWNAAGREVYRATSTAGGDMSDGLMVA